MTTAAARAAAGVPQPYDVDRIRADFPILATRPRGKPLIYLDSAATSQKPRVVIDALRRYYEEENGNIHRGVHYLSERATGLYDDTREAVRRFIGAARAEEHFLRELEYHRGRVREVQERVLERTRS